MLALEIFMIVIGLGSIILSVNMSDHFGADRSSPDIDEAMKELEEREKAFQKKTSQLSEESVLDTEEKLNEISNEKILGINEYSDQVVDKIEKNHAEVVFLYNMLNEKQSELKKVMQEANTLKADLEDGVNSLYREEEASSQELIHEESDNIPTDDANPLQNELLSQEQSPVMSEETSDIQGNMNHRNDEILSLYDEGLSVLEISKRLSMGQGEVKFIIDMFGKNR